MVEEVKLLDLGKDLSFNALAEKCRGRDAGKSARENDVIVLALHVEHVRSDLGGWSSKMDATGIRIVVFLTDSTTDFAMSSLKL